MLGEYQRGNRVTLKRNPNYWKKDAAGNQLPYLDAIVFVVVRDLNASLLNFQQKITDIYGIRGGREIPLLRPRQQEDNFTIYQLGPAYGEEFLTLNMNEEAGRQNKVAAHKIKWFRDARFRRAISHAIDRRSMVQNVLRGLGYPQAAPQTLAPSPYRQDGFEPYAYDPTKAKALLADMGLKDRDGDGVLDDDQGHKVAFTINTNSGNNIREEYMNFVRKDLQSIGIEVNVLSLEFNLLVDKLDVTFEWEAIILGFTGGREPNDASNLWRSSAHLHMWWPNQKTPSFPWEKQIDEIFNNSLSELDKARRKELFRQWIQIVHDEQPIIYLAIPERVAALRNRFGNVFPSPAPDWQGMMHNEEEIFVKDGG
jgi:peptide/nickel transport system substrate-binding protein